MRPKNYRAHRFHLLGRDLTIAGMASPHNNSSINNALAYLRDNEKRTVLIGLNETNFTIDATNNGLEYHHIPVPDFAANPVSPAKYDAIYAVVKKAIEEGKAVTIHSGAGDGRTGTALASLKLRELLEIEAKDNPSILDDNPGNTTSVHAAMVYNGYIPCTPLVKAAVEGIRTQRIATDNSGSHSVETENDIYTLIQYEKHLRLVIKEELKAKQEIERLAAPLAPVQPEPEPVHVEPVPIQAKPGSEEATSYSPEVTTKREQKGLLGTLWTKVTTFLSGLFNAVKNMFYPIKAHGPVGKHEQISTTTPSHEAENAPDAISSIAKMSVGLADSKGQAVKHLSNASATSEDVAPVIQVLEANAISSAKSVGDEIKPKANQSTDTKEHNRNYKH